MICQSCQAQIPDNSAFCNQCGVRIGANVPTTRRTKTRGNGTGTAYKRGKTWTVEVMVGYKWCEQKKKYIPDRLTKGGFRTKKEALDYVPILTERYKKQKAGEAENKRVGKGVVTLKTLWDNYSTSSMLKISKSKQGHYMAAWRKLVKAKITNIPIADLTIQDLQNAVDQQASTYYPAKDMKQVLSHLYTRAQAQQVVLSNLAEFIELPELEESDPFPFNEDDLKKLWSDYGKGNKMTGYILLMIYTGMMPGELFKATKDMIDWDKQQIVGAGLKTKKRKQTPIVIADFLIPVLRDLCEFSQTDKLLAVHRDTFYDEFHEILFRCGIEDRTPYACRHTTATAMALGNIAPTVIQSVMRHAKFSTTERYIHTDRDTATMLNAVNLMTPPKS
ncbi:MAG TPA: tyrosine-type recombinase/integrase [Clostridiales bacterium]|nr:tyrosine-type recombinase/integrase [Clostridiales bacterium]